MAKSVTVIPQTRNIFTAQAFSLPQRRKVAGYARVSTDSDEQYTSYEAQVSYYTKYIQENAEWEFVKVYTDEGISGTNTKHRTGFNEMVSDALAGKIDLIVTKSVSRFARNTVDSLSTIRNLKDHGVEVYFQEQNIWTFDNKGELLITIMSSLAQEESRSISENVTWGIRKSFSDGKVILPYKHFLGYEKGEDGTPVVEESQAAIVRLIYRLFLDGKTPASICAELMRRKIPTPAGKVKWQASTVLSILTNEKYKGDALLQKKFTVDFLTKKQKVNEGEVPQYYVEKSHEAIISPEEFEMVQFEIARRKKAGRTYSGRNALSSKIVCGDCGAFYGQKVWHSTDSYRTTIYRCNRKFDKVVKCSTPTLRMEEIQAAFLKAYNQLMADRKGVIEDCQWIRETLNSAQAIEKDMEKQHEEMTLVAELNRQLIKERARRKMSDLEFSQAQADFNRRYEKAKERYNALSKELEQNRARDKELHLFISFLAKQPLILASWDEQLWNLLVESVTVYQGGQFEFLFIGGKTITVQQ